MTKLVIDLGERKVYWEFSENQMAILLQSFVQSFGPAKGDALGELSYGD